MNPLSKTDSNSTNRFLFIACFVALVATSFAFMIRVMAMSDWQIAFGLTETEKGQIFGAGMWPFGVSIVIFSLFVDKIGYKISMIIAFLCHLISTILLVTATGYSGLIIGSLLNGFAAGIVEAVINPAVATMYPKHKTKMLTILHAGWPGGMVLGGLFIFLLSGIGITAWQVRVAIILLPVLIYGAMLFKTKFPVSERVSAGIPYKDMLKEAGAIGILIVSYMIIMVINDMLNSFSSAAWLEMIDLGAGFSLPCLPFTIIMGGIVAFYLVYTKSLGKGMYIFLLFIMILLAITELGTDTWIKELMGPSMENIGINAGWVLIYTAFIMMMLRIFIIGPLTRKLNPVGILLGSALFAAVGLFFLAKVSGIMILIMATIYGIGQCFFWPVTLGLVAERFPRGGALTLNAIAGVGMLGVGILGSVLLGYWQDTNIEKSLKPNQALYASVMSSEEKNSVFGKYKSLDGSKINEINDKVTIYDFIKNAEKEDKISGQELENIITADKKYQTLIRNAYTHNISNEEKSHDEMVKALKDKGLFINSQDYLSISKDKKEVDNIRHIAKQNAMANVAILPIIMAICYLILIIYFRFKGGYKAIELDS